MHGPFTWWMAVKEFRRIAKINVAFCRIVSYCVGERSTLPTQPEPTP